MHMTDSRLEFMAWFSSSPTPSSSNKPTHQIGAAGGWQSVEEPMGTVQLYSATNDRSSMSIAWKTSEGKADIWFNQIRHNLAFRCPPSFLQRSVYIYHPIPMMILKISSASEYADGIVDNPPYQKLSFLIPRLPFTASSFTNFFV